MTQLASWLLSIFLIFALLNSCLSWHDQNPDRQYSLTVGKSSYENICRRNYYLDSTLLTHNEEFITFDDCGDKIKGVYVKKLNRDYLPERVALIAGGPGHSYATLYFKSQKGEAMSAEVLIYTE